MPQLESSRATKGHVTRFPIYRTRTYTPVQHKHTVPASFIVNPKRRTCEGGWGVYREDHYWESRRKQREEVGRDQSDFCEQAGQAHGKRGDPTPTADHGRSSGVEALLSELNPSPISLKCRSPMSELLK
jgi:hypothetical protein